MTADATLPLVFNGQVCASADGVTYVDVSGEVTKAQIHFIKDELDVPATVGLPRSTRGGGTTATLEVGFLATDGTNGVLWPLVYAASLTAAKTLWFIVTYHTAAGESATNPSWTGSVIVSGGELGGDAETISQTSQTFPYTDLPVLLEV